MNLVEALQQVPDFRSRRGRRYPLWMLLLLGVMSTLCGCCRYREMASFCEANREALVDHFGLRHQRLPVHVTFRNLFKGVDFEALCTVFGQWARQHVALEDGAWLSIDGKALRSTLSDYSEGHQIRLAGEPLCAPAAAGAASGAHGEQAAERDSSGAAVDRNPAPAGGGAHP